MVEVRRAESLFGSNPIVSDLTHNKRNRKTPLLRKRTCSAPHTPKSHPWHGFWVRVGHALSFPLAVFSESMPRMHGSAAALSLLRPSRSFSLKLALGPAGRLGTSSQVQGPLDIRLNGMVFGAGDAGVAREGGSESGCVPRHCGSVLLLPELECNLLLRILSLRLPAIISFRWLSEPRPHRLGVTSPTARSV